METPENNTPAYDGARFTKTHWSVVFLAAKGDSPEAARALEKVCETYWDPLHTYVRRRGYKPEDAEDLTQGFFARLLAQNDLAMANPDRGRFRCFLLSALKHFLANEWRKQTAEKRGNGHVPLSLDSGLDDADGPAIDPADPVTPEMHYERQWALAILNRVILRLQREFEAVGKGEFFTALKEFLHEKQPTAHKELAERFGVSPGAVGVAIHRLRKRYGAILREEIEYTVNDPKEVEDELRYLISILGRTPPSAPENPNPPPADTGAPPRPEPPTGESK